MSNVKLLTKLAEKYLASEYNDLSIRREFGTFLNARVDVFGISQEHIVYMEVRSDRDTLTRLENQLNTFMANSTATYVVLDECHYENYKKKFLTDNLWKYCHVGILIYYKDKEKLVLEKPIKHYNKYPSVYELLTSNELTQFLHYFKGKSKIPKNEEVTKTILESIFTLSEIRNISKAIFLERFTKDCCYFDKEFIYDFDYKQSLFDKWLDESNWNMYEQKTIMQSIKKESGKKKRSSLKVDKI